MSAVYTSTVRNVEPINGSTRLSFITLTSGDKTVAPTEMITPGARFIWIPNGTRVQTKSPIRKIVKSSTVKKRKILGVESEGIILPSDIIEWDKKHSDETNICRRLRIIPPNKYEQVAFAFTPKEKQEVMTRWGGHGHWMD